MKKISVEVKEIKKAVTKIIVILCSVTLFPLHQNSSEQLNAKDCQEQEGGEMGTKLQSLNCPRTSAKLWKCVSFTWFMTCITVQTRYMPKKILCSFANTKLYTRRYNPQRGPSSSYCKGLRPLAEACFGPLAKNIAPLLIWKFLAFYCIICIQL